MNPNYPPQPLLPLTWKNISEYSSTTPTPSPNSSIYSKQENPSNRVQFSDQLSPLSVVPSWRYWNQGQLTMDSESEGRHQQLPHTNISKLPNPLFTFEQTSPTYFPIEIPTRATSDGKNSSETGNEGNGGSRSTPSFALFLGVVTSLDGDVGTIDQETIFHTSAVRGTERPKIGDNVLVKAEASRSTPGMKWNAKEVQVVHQAFIADDMDSPSLSEAHPPLPPITWELSRKRNHEETDNHADENPDYSYPKKLKLHEYENSVGDICQDTESTRNSKCNLEIDSKITVKTVESTSQINEEPLDDSSVVITELTETQVESESESLNSGNFASAEITLDTFDIDENRTQNQSGAEQIAPVEVLPNSSATLQDIQIEPKNVDMPNWVLESINLAFDKFSASLVTKNNLTTEISKTKDEPSGDVSTELNEESPVNDFILNFPANIDSDSLTTLTDENDSSPSRRATNRDEVEIESVMLASINQTISTEIIMKPDHDVSDEKTVESEVQSVGGDSTQINSTSKSPIISVEVLDEHASDSSVYGISKTEFSLTEQNAAVQKEIPNSEHQNPEGVRNDPPNSEAQDNGPNTNTTLNASVSPLTMNLVIESNDRLRELESPNAPQIDNAIFEQEIPVQQADKRRYISPKKMASPAAIETRKIKVEKRSQWSVERSAKRKTNFRQRVTRVVTGMPRDNEIRGTNGGFGFVEGQYGQGHAQNRNQDVRYRPNNEIWYENYNDFLAGKDSRQFNGMNSFMFRGNVAQEESGQFDGMNSFMFRDNVAQEESRQFNGMNSFMFGGNEPEFCQQPREPWRPPQYSIPPPQVNSHFSFNQYDPTFHHPRETFIPPLLDDYSPYQPRNCGVCGRSDHHESVCWDRPRKFDAKPSRTRRHARKRLPKCENCGKFGHRSNKCWQPPKNVDHDQGSQIGKREYKNEPGTGSVSRGVMPNTFCKLCKNFGHREKYHFDV